jgi:hypothetical protein
VEMQLKSTCFFTIQTGIGAEYFSMTTSLFGEDVSFFSISGSNAVQQNTMIAGSTMSLQTNNEWKALPPLGPYYGKAWYIKQEGKGAFDTVINRTAAAARLMPKHPNLET